MISAIYKQQRFIEEYPNSNYCEKYILTTEPISDERQKDSDLIIQHFETEQEMIIGFAKIIYKKRPDIISGFNDYDFDWYVIFKRLVVLDNSYKLLLRFYGYVECIPSYHFTTNIEKIMKDDKSIKSQNPRLTIPRDSSTILKGMFIDARIKIPKRNLSNNVQIPNFNSMLCIDTSILCQKFVDNKTSSYKLNTFAQMIGNQKENLEYFQQLQIYRNGSHEHKGKIYNMFDTATYCNQDSYLLIDLWDHFKFLDNVHQLSTMSFVKLQDGFIKADGAKTINMVIYYSNKEQIIVPTVYYNVFTSQFSKVSYEGAYVEPPTPGLINDAPVFALDFKSLYPSIIIGYNLSPMNVQLESIYQKDDLPASVGNTTHKSILSDGRVLVGKIFKPYIPSDQSSMTIYPKILKNLFNK